MGVWAGVEHGSVRNDGRWQGCCRTGVNRETESVGTHGLGSKARLSQSTDVRQKPVRFTSSGGTGTSCPRPPVLDGHWTPTGTTTLLWSFIQLLVSKINIDVIVVGNHGYPRILDPKNCTCTRTSCSYDTIILLPSFSKFLLILKSKAHRLLPPSPVHFSNIKRWLLLGNDRIYMRPSVLNEKKKEALFTFQY